MSYACPRLLEPQEMTLQTDQYKRTEVATKTPGASSLRWLIWSVLSFPSYHKSNLFHDTAFLDNSSKLDSKLFHLRVSFELSWAVNYWDPEIDWAPECC